MGRKGGRRRVLPLLWACCCRGGQAAPRSAGELGEARQAQPRAGQGRHRGHAGPSPLEGARSRPPLAPQQLPLTPSVPPPWHSSFPQAQLARLPVLHPHPNRSVSPAGSRRGGRGGVSRWGGGCPSPASPAGSASPSSVPGWRGEAELSPAPPRWAGRGAPREPRVSAGAAGRAGFRAVAHQALVGLEAGQGLAAGQGGQGAAEPQHGGRGVLPCGQRGASRGGPAACPSPATPGGRGPPLRGQPGCPCTAGAASHPRGGGCWWV